MSLSYYVISLRIATVLFLLVGCQTNAVDAQGNTKPQARLVLESGAQRIILGEQESGDEPVSEILGGFGVRLLDTQRGDSVFIGWGSPFRTPSLMYHMRTGDGMKMQCDLTSDGMLQVWESSDSVKARLYYDAKNGILGVSLANGGKWVGMKIDKDGSIQIHPEKQK